jgi:hypothetical protein
VLTRLERDLDDLIEFVQRSDAVVAIQPDLEWAAP